MAFVKLIICVSEMPSANLSYFIYCRKKLTAKSKTFCSIDFNLQCGCDETENALTISSLLSPILYALPAGLVAVTRRP